MSDLEVLHAIMRHDPDGYFTRPPTEADYAQFAAWAIMAYGREAWDRYVKGGWEPFDGV